jgi:[ribosomal protein S5]-alanine N-acetyltransferase
MTPLETERLIVRAFKAEDAADLFEYLSLPETYAFEPGDPIDLAEAKRLAAERAAGDSFYAVELKDTGKMVGHLYFARTQPEEFLTWELGYIFNPAFHRRGYCSEASRALLAYAFRELHAHRVVAFCDPQNPASWKTLESIGLKREGFFPQKAFFRRDKEGRPLWHDCLAYGITEGSYSPSSAYST